MAVKRRLRRIKTPTKFTRHKLNSEEMSTGEIKMSIIMLIR
jgi:hypothetical protein